MPLCKLQERGFWVLEKFHLGTSILSQSSVLWEIPVGLQTPSVRATLQERPLDLPLIIEATTTLTFSDRFALPRRKQLEDDPCRMDYHVPQVPPLYMPEPGGSITFQLRPAQEQQVLLPSQTTLCKVTPGHTGNRASSASAPIGISPRGSTQHLVTISSWKQAPELPSLHAWRCIGSCPHPAQHSDTYHDVDGLLAGCAHGDPAIGGSAPADPLLLGVGMASRRFAVGGVQAARSIP